MTAAVMAILGVAIAVMCTILWVDTGGGAWWLVAMISVSYAVALGIVLYQWSGPGGHGRGGKGDDGDGER